MMQLKAVPPPERPVLRVARGLDPFEPAPWSRADPEDGTFGNRFDDPGKARGIPEEERFRMLYASTQRVCAFAETLARLRPSHSTLDGIARVEHDEPFDRNSFIARIDEEWRVKRRIGSMVLDSRLRFVDLADHSTLAYLDRVFARRLAELGLRDMDLSAVTSQHRTLTQEIARYIYEQRDQNGEPLFAGIRYVSRLGDDWECWAIFSDRLGDSRSSPPQNIFADDPGLVEAAALYGLEIEVLDGKMLPLGTS